MGNIILERQAVVCLEEEPSFGTRATTPFGSAVYIRPERFEVNENPEYVKMQMGDGRRIQSRKEIVAKGVEWSLRMDVHPKLLGWFFKWAVGQQINPATGQYQYTPVEINVEQKSFTFYVDYKYSDLWGDGEDTAYALGCKVSRMLIEASGMDNDHRMMMTLEGMAQKIYGSAANTLTGTVPLHYARTLLYNSAEPTTFMFKNAIVNWDGGGYLSTNYWKRFAIEVQNTLEPETFAEEGTDVYVSQINTTTQMIRCEFDKNFLSAALTDDLLAGTTRDLKVRVTHKDAYDAGSNKYRFVVNVPRFSIDEQGPILSGGGGDAKVERTHVGEAITDLPVTDVDNTSAAGTDDHILVITTADTNLEANKFTTVNGGYLCYVLLPLKTGSPASTGDIVVKIYSDDGGGDPDTLIAGGTSNTFSTETLTTSYQTIPFFFPDHPLLSATTDYHIVITRSGAGSNDVIVDGDTGGTNTHTASTDGGSTWAANDADDYGYQVIVDEIALAIDYYTDGSYADVA